MPRATLVLMVFFLLAAPAMAQQTTGSAARIVVIKPKEGMQRQFKEGYKRHLDWHRQNKDAWTWYGWQVITGERLGYFVDGTFGHGWDDFDRSSVFGESHCDADLSVSLHTAKTLQPVVAA